MKIRLCSLVAGVLAFSLAGTGHADNVYLADYDADNDVDAVVVTSAFGEDFAQAEDVDSDGDYDVYVFGVEFNAESCHAPIPHQTDVAIGLSLGCAGAVIGTTVPSPPRGPAETDNDRAANGQCAFRVDTTDGNNVLLTVRGTGTASGRPRAVATEIQCRVLNEAGDVVFDLTRAEVGSVAPLAGGVIIRNDGPYTVCARADAKFDDGEDVSWPYPDDFVTMACDTP